MAWNGRNESILGSKPTLGEVPAVAPSKEAADASPAPLSVGSPAEASKGPAARPAPIPAKNVWGGRHVKIMELREKPAETAPTPISVTSVPVRAPSPAVSSLSQDSKKEAKEVIVSPPKDIKAPRLQPLAPAKEDETTNSTAGSSTANTTITEEDPASVEVKVVPTTVSSGGEKKKEKGAGGNKGASEEKKKGSAGGNNATPKAGKGGNNNNSSNRQNGQAKNGGGNANGAGSRRAGKNNKGGQGNIKNGGNNAGNGNARQNYSKGNNGSGISRRKNGAATVTAVAEKPVCAFFLRGMCNRGTSCAFKHDPSMVPTGSGTHLVATSRPFVPSKRVFDPYKARAIQLAKEAQDKEDRTPYSTAKRIPGEEKKHEAEIPADDPPFLSIDVECVATGYGSCARGINDGCGNEGQSKEGVPAEMYNERSHRYPGRVALVDTEGNVLADIVVRPPRDGAGVISYLTPLTGLTAEMCLGPDAKLLEEAVAIVKGLLPKDGVLVGQAIDHDVQWLGLVPGVDFERTADISDLFRQRMPSTLPQAAEVLKRREAEGIVEPSTSNDTSTDEYLGFATRYRHFSLRHVCLNLLSEDIQSGVHNPVVDAQYSLTLFHKYRDASATQLRIVRDGLHRAPITPGFAAENVPVIDGVCLSALGYPYKRAARKIWRWYAKRQSS